MHRDKMKTERNVIQTTFCGGKETVLRGQIQEMLSGVIINILLIFIKSFADRPDQINVNNFHVESVLNWQNYNYLDRPDCNFFRIS